MPPDDPLAKSAQRLPAAGPSTEGTRVLVVEDEAIIAAYLKWRLERLGFAVVGIADTGADALALAEATRPALVLMDIVLQGPTDGVQTAEALAERVDVPVIFVTAHTDEATFQRALGTAPYGYLVKPVEERELRIAIALALTRHRHELRARGAAR